MAWRRVAGLGGAVLALAVLGSCVSGSGEGRGSAVSEALRAAAVEARDQKDYATAAEQYGKIFERDAADRDAAVGYLDSLRRIGAWDEARTALARGREALGDDSAFLVAAAKIQLAEGQAAQALADLDRARGKAPRNWEIYSLTGIAYDALNNSAAAQAAYKAGLEMAPGNPVILNNQALSLAQSGRIDEAIRILQGLLDTRQRGSPQIRQNLAILHGFKGNLKEFEALARGDLREDILQRNLEVFRALRAEKGTKGP
ncbi:MAG: tetratricopeptide repeat protein [Magnetospirillum sp. WYHS-4]